ncbi:MAG: hypothetical protein A3B30_02565 [Candidatus Komeilibacteria bacterium RIFCSPLOWO2_01_FULL_52_15]|uniref:Type II secretion system protein GspF domain-containing protein n=1 Tax=Candidatus Komeilibacteria bacterium RIFCSPLOWO2_01_FULL_52_15 TaxID=1798551 RepID=A0A1G2BRD7_9BACT|nr:MAG: hypothetical protein A3B30_02565 [Candidatus Komeilibacteria bacterium RIFCSPLOWO2_01_FULL_52_15]
MQFRYQVLDANKKLLQGDVEADSLKSARISLLHQGYDVLLLESVQKRYVKFEWKRVGFVKQKDKMLFVKHLSLMIKSGMVLDESLETLYEQSEGRMRSIVRRLTELVRKGNLLSDGLKLFPYTFNEFFVNMIRVGEKSGSLEQTLINLSVKLKKDHDLNSKVRGALMYPMIVMIALGGLVFTLAVYILPKLLRFFKELTVTIPTMTRIFIAASELFEKYWYVGMLGLIGLLVLVVVMNRLPKTKNIIHWFVYHLPISHKFSKSSNLANFCRSMNIMLQHGVTIDEALDIMTRATTSTLYQVRLRHVLDAVRTGRTISEGLQEYPKFFPPIITRMIHVGEVSGNLAETFEYLAEFFEDDVDALSKNLSVTLEPVLLLVIGSLVGFMALAIISPIYQLTGGITR